MQAAGKLPLQGLKLHQPAQFQRPCSTHKTWISKVGSDIPCGWGSCSQIYENPSMLQSQAGALNVRCALFDSGRTGELTLSGCSLRRRGFGIDDQPAQFQRPCSTHKRWTQKVGSNIPCGWGSCSQIIHKNSSLLQSQAGPLNARCALFDAGGTGEIALSGWSLRRRGFGIDAAGDGTTRVSVSSEGAVMDGSVITGDGSELENTRRMVETAMLAATAGLAYFLSNMLRLEAYFGCFFPLPIVISSVRWNAAAGRKTMVATAILLLVIAGPLKALTYLLMHGFVGLAMGSIWRWRWNWWVSIVAVTLVRCAGAFCFFALSSWLIRENLLALLMLNAHTSLSHMLASIGLNMVPSMAFVYAAAVALLLINCSTYVFLLHILYAVFLRRLGLSGFSSAPKWVDKAS